jgi:ketosteroid isomerase-like protein
MKTLLLTALLATLALSASAQSPAEAAVRAAHDRFLAAAKKGDAAELAKLLDARLQYSHSNAKLETKQEAIDALVKSPSNFEIHSQTIHVHGNVATLRAKLTAHGAAGDTPLSMLQVWVKNGKDWQLVERQTTRLPAQ